MHIHTPYSDDHNFECCNNFQRATIRKVCGILVAFGGATFVVLWGADSEMQQAKNWWLSHVLFFFNVNAWSM